MSDKIYTLEELRVIIKPLLAEYHAESAILFGSYARGEATVHSDIDLVVIGGKDFDKTDIFAMAEDLYESSGKNVDVYEITEIGEGHPLQGSIPKEGITIG